MMIMRKIWILLTLCFATIACKKVEVQFTYSPEKPKAGETVTFSNLSSSGEEWTWSFGDGATSTLKYPSHVYKKPGTYVVTLKVDNKSSRTATKEITVYDTIPTFVCEDTVFYIYKDYTFNANVYNPYNYPLEYSWFITDSVVSDKGSSFTCYFVKPDANAEVRLDLTMNNEALTIRKSFFIHDLATNSVLFRTAEGDYRQRIFGARAEQAQIDGSAAALLNTETDTVQVYNGYEFRLSELKTVFPDLQGFHIANRKIYYRWDGLWVANIDGTNAVQIDAEPCAAMTLDTHDNRIYWANAQGVWYMPFVGSDNNKFVTVPTQLNTLTNVTKIAADGEHE